MHGRDVRRYRKPTARVKNECPPSPVAQLFWNPTKQRYEDAQGKAIPPDTIRAWIDAAIVASIGIVGAISRLLLSGDINLLSWRNRIATELLHGHIAAGEIASGGRAQFTPTQAVRVGTRVTEQLDYLDNFAAEIASDKIAIPEREIAWQVPQQFDFLVRPGLQVAVGLPQPGSRIVSRSELYPEAIRGTYEGIRRGNHVDAGFTVERSILGGGGDSCEQCIEQEKAGWVAIGELVEIGQRSCLSRCNCTFHYSREAFEATEGPLPVVGSEPASLPTTTGPRSTGRPAPEHMTETARNIAAKLKELYPDLPDRWSGNLVVDGMPYGGMKDWTCDVKLGEAIAGDAQRRGKVLIHELLHARSRGLTPEAYVKHTGWEEGVVEGVTREVYPKVSKAVGDRAPMPDISDNPYNGYIDGLKKVHRLTAKVHGLKWKPWLDRMLHTDLADRRGLVSRDMHQLPSGNLPRALDALDEVHAQMVPYNPL